MQGRLGLHKRRSVVATASIADKRVLRQLKVSSCQNNSVKSLFMKLKVGFKVSLARMRRGARTRETKKWGRTGRWGMSRRTRRKR